MLYLYSLLAIIADASQNKLVRLDQGCTCPNHYVIFECTVVESLTIWHGSAFDCDNINNEIVLFHYHFNTSTGSVVQYYYCNNGAIVAHIVSAQDNCYTSQLNVTLSPALLNKSIVCAIDNGTSFYGVGSSILSGRY